VWLQVGPTAAAAAAAGGSASAPSTNAHGDATAVGPAATEKPSFSVLVLPEQESIRDEDHDIVDEMSVFQLLLAHRAARECGVDKAALVGQVFTRPSVTSVLAKAGTSSIEKSLARFASQLLRIGLEMSHPLRIGVWRPRPSSR
jgi:hypothetical protein